MNRMGKRVTCDYGNGRTIGQFAGDTVASNVLHFASFDLLYILESFSLSSRANFFFVAKPPDKNIVVVMSHDLDTERNHA